MEKRIPSKEAIDKACEILSPDMTCVWGIPEALKAAYAIDVKPRLRKEKLEDDEFDSLTQQASAWRTIHQLLLDLGMVHPESDELSGVETAVRFIQDGFTKKAKTIVLSEFERDQREGTWTS